MVQKILICVILLSTCTWSVGIPVAYLYLLRVFHQNDIHSHFAPVQQDTQVCPKTWRSSLRCFGGFARAVRFIKKQKNHSESLNLNAGDFFGGNLVYSLFGPDVVNDMVPFMPYQAIALGHSEFYYGIDKLYSFMKRVGHKFVCTNIRWDRMKDTRKARELGQLCPRHRILKIGPQWGGQQKPMSVGVLGFTTPDTALMAATDGVQFLDEVSSLQAEVWKLMRRRIHIIVAVGHSGHRRNMEIAREVYGLDILVGGHSHSLLTDGQWQPFVPHTPEGTTDEPQGMYPTVVIQKKVRNVLVLQAYRHGKYMGFIDVGLDIQGEVKDWWPDLRLLDQSYGEDPEVLQVLHKYDKKLEEALPQVLGQTEVALDGRPEVCNVRECNMANLVADAVLWANRRDEAFGAPVVDVVLVPAEVLRMRESVPPGAVTLQTLTELLPYGHTFSVLQVPGQAVWNALRSSAASRNASNGRFLQVSGLEVTINEALREEQRLQSVFVLEHCEGCSAPKRQRLNVEVNYSVAMPDYVADGGAEYGMFNRHVLELVSLDKYLLDLDAVMQYLKSNTPVKPRLEGRIKIVNTMSNTKSAATRITWSFPVLAIIMAPIK